MNKSKFVLRMDDICPGMDWDKFLKVKHLLDAHQIKPLIGVVPNNKDPKLMPFPKRVDFWDLVRTWQEKGWTVAQHGFEHIYHTKDSGIFKLTNQAEFAGLPFERQHAMLENGKQLLLAQGIETDIFMAPSHSLDLNTLRALRAAGFRYVTDGYGLFPYHYKGLVFVPQLFATPINFGFGIYTICLHTNDMTDKEIGALGDFISKKKARFITFRQAASYLSDSYFNTTIAKGVFQGIRKAKNMLFIGKLTAGQKHQDINHTINPS